MLAEAQVDGVNESRVYWNENFDMFDLLTIGANSEKGNLLFQDLNIYDSSFEGINGFPVGVDTIKFKNCLFFNTNISALSQLGVQFENCIFPTKPREEVVRVDMEDLFVDCVFKSEPITDDQEREQSEIDKILEEEGY